MINKPKRKRGRPETRVLKLNVSSPEEAFRRIFEAADPPLRKAGIKTERPRTQHSIDGTYPGLPDN